MAGYVGFSQANNVVSADDYIFLCMLDDTTFGQNFLNLKHLSVEEL